MAGTASGTCAASPRDTGGERHRLWPAAAVAFVLSRWQAPPAAQAEAGNPGQLPGSLLASPRLSSPRHRGEPSQPCVCVHA